MGAGIFSGMRFHPARSLSNRRTVIRVVVLAPHRVSLPVCRAACRTVAFFRTSPSPSESLLSGRRLTVLMPRERGFSLVELAIVLVIVSLLLGGLWMPLSAQNDVRRSTQTQNMLATAHDALLGYAALQGRLPCPTTATGAGVGQYCTDAATCGAVTTTFQSHGRCATPLEGFLPAVELGLQPVDASGRMLDAWNQPVRYAITTDQHFTSTEGLKSIWANPATPPAPNIEICQDAACGTILSRDAVAVIFSTGRTGATRPLGADESENLESPGDTRFISRTPSPDFDDRVIWLSPYLLYGRLIAAGRLP